MLTVRLTSSSFKQHAPQLQSSLDVLACSHISRDIDKEQPLPPVPPSSFDVES